MIAKQGQFSRTALDPTPDEIRRRCKQVQKKWSESVRERRAGRQPKQWLPPTYKANDFPELETERN